MTDGNAPVARGYPVSEQEFLEDNIATVAHHLGQPGARLTVDHIGYKSSLSVDPGEVLKEISRRLTRDPAQTPTKEDFAKWSRVWHDTCETMVTLLGLPGSGSPQELLAQVQAYVGTRPHAQGAVSCGVTDQDKIETLQKLVAEYKERAIEVVRAEIALGAQGAVAPWLWACTGCGSQMTMDQIKGEHPNALCCCPERRMAPLPSTDSQPFYGAECPSYPHCSGGCGLGCTKEIETAKVSSLSSTEHS